MFSYMRTWIRAAIGGRLLQRRRHDSDSGLAEETADQGPDQVPGLYCTTGIQRPRASPSRGGFTSRWDLRVAPVLSGSQLSHPVLFCGKNIVVVSHGLKKEGEVPAVEIDRAM